MKIIYFERAQRRKLENIISAAFRGDDSSFARCLYIPEEDVLLANVSVGVYGYSHHMGIVTQPDRLEEAKMISQGTTPYGGKYVEFRAIKEFEYDDSKLRELIQNAKSKAKLKTKVLEAFEKILKEEALILPRMF